MGLRNALLGAAAAIGVAGCEVPQETKPAPAPTTEAAPAAPEVGQTTDETAKKAAEAAKVPGEAPEAPEAAPFDPETIKYLGKKLYVTNQATGEGLKLRSAPDGTKEDNILLRMPAGSEMTVVTPSQGDYQGVLYTGPDGQPKFGWAAMRNAGATYLSETKEAPVTPAPAPAAPEVKESFQAYKAYVVSTPDVQAAKAALRDTPVKTVEGKAVVGNEVARLDANTEVTVLGEENGWLKVKTGSGQEGYILGTLTTKEAPAAPAPAPKAPEATGFEQYAAVVEVSEEVTKAGGLKLRSAPDSTKTDNVLAQLAGGTSVTVTGRDGTDWLKVKTADGKEGYVAGKFLNRVNPTPDAKK